MKNKTDNSFLYNNSLSLAFLLLAVITIIAQVFTGRSQYNTFLLKHHQNSVGFIQYLSSGHFIEPTVILLLPNWSPVELYTLNGKLSIEE